MPLSKQIRDWLVDNYNLDLNATDAQAKAALSAAMLDGSLTADEVAELSGAAAASNKGADAVRGIVRETVDAMSGTPAGKSSGMTGKQAFGSGASIRVKAPGEAYSNVKSVALNKFGKPVRGADGNELTLPSQRECAVWGSWLKQKLLRSGLSGALSEHENELLAECYSGDFCGYIGGEHYDALPGARVKALLNDGTSGGQELVPVEFDSAVIANPILNGELFPLADVVNVSRASVESATVASPSVGWSTAEGSAITPFTTTSMVADFSCTVKPLTAALLFGRDLAADAAVDIGALFTRLIGEAVMSEFDRAIAVGVNSSNEPTGVFVASGTTSVPSTMGIIGPWTVSDLEAIYFALPKAIRAQRANNVVLISNDTTYQRVRGIPVGSDDARRVFGMSYSDYQTGEIPHKINNSISDGYLACAAMKYYRWYRRTGLDIQIQTQGYTLPLANEALLIARTRAAGKPTLGSAVAICTDGATTDG
jgi:HK97 family phage major capsid protein